jgi:hypothetical protein
MTEPGNLPANWTAGGVFTAAAENAVETAINWLLGVFNGATTGQTLTNPTIAGYTEAVTAVGTVTTSSTLSVSSGTLLTATLTASTACTFTMPTPTAGKSFTLLLKQPASTGNGTATFAGVKWPGGVAPTITPTAGEMDILSFCSDGTDWFGSYAQGYTY